MSTVASASEELAARLQTVRAAMSTRGLDALALVSPEDVYYLAGLNHQGYFAFTMLVVGLEGPLLLVIREMERPTIEVQAAHCEHVTYRDDEDPAVAAVGALRTVTEPGSAIGVQRDQMNLPIALWDRVRVGLADRRQEDGSGLVAAARAIKSPAEIELMRRAAQATDAAIAAGQSVVAPGTNELEVAAAVYRTLLLEGSEAPGFAAIVRSGDTLTQEHVTWRDRSLAAGDALFLELSASISRYHAPSGRLVYVDQAPEGAADAAQVARHGMETTVETLRPGVTSGDVYAAWQRTIDDGLGHSRHRRHHCGYMVGIGFPPSWTGGHPIGLRAGGDVVIEAGMTFHAISWVPGPNSVPHLVSDTVVVTADGCELLTSTDRGLIVTGR